MIENLLKYQGAKRSGPYKEIADDILLIPFWQEDFCRDVIRATEVLDEFMPYQPDIENDAAPAQETRIDRISPKFAEEFGRHLEEYLFPIIQTHWWPLNKGVTRMPFVLRYSNDTQASLNPHHDAASVSLAMLLNTEYEGGYLTFPRQHWDTRDVPVGHFVAFPSSVTHVHWVSPVTAGVRYAMTCWIAEAKSNPPDAIFS